MLVAVYVCREIRAPQRHPDANRNCWREGTLGAAMGAVAGGSVGVIVSRRSSSVVVRLRF
jgi:uncharacterized protein YcfJ